MIVSFELTMPNRGSWNGRWSGEENKYYKIRKFKGKEAHKVRELLFAKSLSVDGDVSLVSPLRESWYYRWEDGWGASVIAEVVDAYTSKKRIKVSSGFCGYDWMIDSILKHGKIYASHEEIPVTQ